eukprot:90276_1
MFLLILYILTIGCINSGNAQHQFNVADYMVNSGSNQQEFNVSVISRPVVPVGEMDEPEVIDVDEELYQSPANWSDNYPNSYNVQSMSENSMRQTGLVVFAQYVGNNPTFMNLSAMPLSYIITERGYDPSEWNLSVRNVSASMSLTGNQVAHTNQIDICVD